MGMFTAIGSIFGPVGAGVGAVADYAMAKKNARDEVRQREDSQQKLNQMALQQERESILGRVDAAKAAGLHPLVAMGAQGLGGPVVPASGPDFPDFGGPMPDFRPVGPARSADAQRYDKARADLAELEVELAKRRLSEQPGNGGAPHEINALTGTGVIVPGSATPHPVSHVKIEGQSLPPAAADVAWQTPGTAPGWDVVQAGGFRDPSTGRNKALKLVVPGGSVQRENWGEQLGELPIWLLPEVVRQSSQASGVSSGEWIRRVLFGSGGAEAPVTPRKGGGSREVYGPVR